MKKTLILTILLGLTVFVAGCIVTGTFVTTVRLVPDDSGSSLTVTGADVTDSEIEVDLDDDADFEEYEDNINDIDNVGFYLDITNNNPDPVTFQLFIEEDLDANWDQDSLQQIIDSASYLFLTDLVIPGSSNRIVTWNESLDMITDFGNIKPIIQSGEFSLYPLAFPRDEFNVTIDSMVVIVTFTAKR